MTNNLSQFTTDELINEICIRSDAFAIAYEMPSNDENRMRFIYNTEDFYKSFGLAHGLLKEMNFQLEYGDEIDE